MNHDSHIASVGFTGTQAGIESFQIQRLARVLEDFYRPGNEFHHGDCVGADYSAAEIAHNLGFQIVVHPPTNPKARAFTTWGTVLPEKPYLDRNQDIVDAADILIATPASKDEKIRSGTWATIRRARKKGIPIILVTPEGVIIESRNQSMLSIISSSRWIIEEKHQLKGFR